MRKFTTEEVRLIIENNDIAVVHLDAEWDSYRLIVERKINEILAQNPNDVAFAYVDIDEQMELAQSLKVRNVPMVIYFRYGKIVGSVVGQQQDIGANLAKVRVGGLINESNVISRY